MNELTGSIPEGIGALDKITYLYLNDNKLSGIPECFGEGMSSLNELSLCNNKFSMLPKTFGQGLMSLQQLRLQNNDMTELPLSITILTNLTLLQIDGKVFDIPVESPALNKVIMLVI
jgi:Leucine-rich repeat (LRR) protein